MNKQIPNKLRYSLNFKPIRLIVFAILFGECCVQAQSRAGTDSLAISFHFTSSVIRDSSDLAMSIICKNLTNRSVDTYRYLESGWWNDVLSNLHIEIQREINGSFRRIGHSDGQPMLYAELVDSLRHYDLPKKKLKPFQSDALKIKLLDEVGFLDVGWYRIKAHLRIKTVQDNTPHEKDDLDSVPPQDSIIYKSSEWMYFRVENPVPFR